MKIDLTTERYITVDVAEGCGTACLWLSDGSLAASTYLAPAECRKLAAALLEAADELDEPE